MSSDDLRRILVDAGLDPRLHGGVDGAVLLLVGRWREAEAKLAAIGELAAADPVAAPVLGGLV